jgi:hypothetical protein
MYVMRAARIATILSLSSFLFIPLSVSADEGLRPLYWSCVNNSCAPATEAARDGDNDVLLGYIKESAEPGTAPLYWACAYLIHLDGCGQRKLAAQPRYDDAVLLGYIAVEPEPGTLPLYWSCKQRDAAGECVRLAPDNQDGTVGDSRFLGYVYAGDLNKEDSL